MIICIIKSPCLKLLPDGISWMPNCLIQKLSQSVFVANWLALLLKMPSFLKRITIIFFIIFVDEVALTGQDGRFSRQQSCCVKNFCFSYTGQPIFVIDSFPLAVCKFGRAWYCCVFRGYGVEHGKYPSKKETYFGYKVHVMIALEGYITTFEITPAYTDTEKDWEIWLIVKAIL